MTPAQLEKAQRARERKKRAQDFQQLGEWCQQGKTDNIQDFLLLLLLQQQQHQQHQQQQQLRQHQLEQQQQEQQQLEQL